MTEELIIKCCAPTLAGLKLGSIVCLSNCRKDTLKEMRECEEVLRSKGLDVKLCRSRKGQQLIYVYRPDELKGMVSEKCNACLLRKYGYNTENAESAVERLMERIRYEEKFPHEIGLFLGYPVEDVAGYIRNNGRNYITYGLWKVYDNEDKAIKRFDSYKKCTRVYMKCYKKGYRLDRLTVQKQSEQN